MTEIQTEPVTTEEFDIPLSALRPPRTPLVLRQYARKVGLSPTDGKLALVHALRSTGSFREAAELLGISTDTLIHYRFVYNVYPPASGSKTARFYAQLHAQRANEQLHAQRAKEAAM